MADLPDIDTSTVSFLAYWNAIDQGGVSDIDPTEVTSATDVDTYTAYDNGVEGTILLETGNQTNNRREATFRVKEDGWFVVYIDRATNWVEDTQTRSDIYGPWDIFWYDRYEQGDAPLDSAEQNRLERAINELYAELSNSGDITYNSSDVGLYFYIAQSATTLTSLGQSFANDTTKTIGFQYTSSTDRKWHAMVASSPHDGNGPLAEYTDGGGTTQTLVSDKSNSGGVWGARNALSNGDFSDPGTEYTGTLTDPGGSYWSIIHYNISAWK